MDIDSMEAGPEMDALVAEKVMEFHRIDNGQYGEYWRAPTAYHPIGTSRGLPPFSTDIAAAWQVVERMRKFDMTFSIHGNILEEPLYQVYFVVRGGAWMTYAEDNNPALTICRAALEAVMHQEGH